MGLPQRSAPRYPVALRVAFSGAEVLLSEQATNISAGGMFVRTERYLPAGTLVSVALELPDGAPPAPVRAKVVHVALPSRSPQRWSNTGIGVQFMASGSGQPLETELVMSFAFWSTSAQSCVRLDATT